VSRKVRKATERGQVGRSPERWDDENPRAFHSGPVQASHGPRETDPRTSAHAADRESASASDCGDSLINQRRPPARSSVIGRDPWVPLDDGSLNTAHASEAPLACGSTVAPVGLEPTTRGLPDSASLHLSEIPRTTLNYPLNSTNTCRPYWQVGCRETPRATASWFHDRPCARAVWTASSRRTDAEHENEAADDRRTPDSGGAEGATTHQRHLTQGHRCAPAASAPIGVPPFDPADPSLGPGFAPP